MKGIVLFLFAALAFVQSDQGIESGVGDGRDWANIKPAYRVVEPISHPLKYSGIRIVGGNEAVHNAYPFQAGLLLTTPDGTLFCGGSLISKLFVLTAAHCLSKASSVEIILGAHNVVASESTQQHFVSTTFTVHEEYDSGLILNDIATIQLPSEATLNEYVQLVTLPGTSDASNTFIGYAAIAIGWGRTSDSSTISSVLRYVETQVITNALCTQTYGAKYVHDSNICTTGTGGIGTCSGDSGGPLIVDGKLVGLTSYGSSDGCSAGDPGAFTRVTSFLDWIQSNSDVIIS